MSLEANQDKATELISQAIDFGINYFDTADLYQAGLNEEMVGKAIGAKRKQVVLASKVGNQLRADGSGWDWNPRKEYILSSVEKSLRRLGTDYIDLYQLHGGTIEDPIDETIEAFELLKAQGKIRYYGISSIRPNVIREYVKRSSIISVMMQYSLLDRRPEESCLELLEQNNISVLARGVLAGGLLVNKPAKEYLGHSTKEVEAIQNHIKAIPHAADAIAIQFALSKPVVASAIIGIRTQAQLEAAVKGLEIELSSVELQQLKEVVGVKVYEAHRG